MAFVDVKIIIRPCSLFNNQLLAWYIYVQCTKVYSLYGRHVGVIIPSIFYSESVKIIACRDYLESQLSRLAICNSYR